MNTFLPSVTSTKFSVVKMWTLFSAKVHITFVDSAIRNIIIVGNEDFDLIIIIAMLEVLSFWFLVFGFCLVDPRSG